VLRQRVLTAAVGAPVLLAAAYSGGWIYGAAIAALLAAGLLEAARLANLRDPGDLSVLAAAGAPLFACLAAGRGDMLGAGLAAGLFLVAVRQVLRHPAVSTAASGSLWLLASYLGVGFGHFVALRALPDGLRLTTLAFLLTWGFDCAAYFVGLRYGRHKMVPRLSPGKSWEGAVAGAVLAVGLAALPWAWWPGNTPFRLTAAGLVIVMGQLGDWFESSLKRNAAVKDSGQILPGHGGILDRFDSLLLTMPALYHLARLWPGGPGA
jgi:phosphatidate cytidylyltransferase